MMPFILEQFPSFNILWIACFNIIAGMHKMPIFTHIYYIFLNKSQGECAHSHIRRCCALEKSGCICRNFLNGSLWKMFHPIRPGQSPCYLWYHWRCCRCWVLIGFPERWEKFNPSPSACHFCCAPVPDAIYGSSYSLFVGQIKNIFDYVWEYFLILHSRRDIIHK